MRKEVLKYNDKVHCPRVMHEAFSTKKIEWIKDEYLVHNVEIHLLVPEGGDINCDAKLEKVLLLDGKHPNCNPRNKEFCLPPDLLEQEKVELETIKIILDLCLSQYNLMHAYFIIPTKDYKTGQEIKTDWC